MEKLREAAAAAEGALEKEGFVALSTMAVSTKEREVVWRKVVKSLSSVEVNSEERWQAEAAE